MVICLQRGADLHMAQLMPLPLTVSCFSKIQIGFTFPVPAHLGSPGKGPLNGCVCVFVRCWEDSCLPTVGFICINFFNLMLCDDISNMQFCCLVCMQKTICALWSMAACFL